MRRFALLLLTLSAPVAAQTATPPPPPGCDTPESHQFDFWVGKWEVHPNGADKIIAHSLIEKRYTGCAIRENWMPLQGTGGGSLNTYRPEKSVWRQVWTDSLNNLNEYAGSFANGVMTLTGLSHPARGAPAPVRMTYEAKPDGSVVQTGYRSADRGQSWQLSYQFVYRRSPQH